jgi:hypothetical protein
MASFLPVKSYSFIKAPGFAAPNVVLSKGKKKFISKRGIRNKYFSA